MFCLGKKYHGSAVPCGWFSVFDDPGAAANDRQSGTSVIGVLPGQRVGMTADEAVA